LLDSESNTLDCCRYVPDNLQLYVRSWREVGAMHFGMQAAEEAGAPARSVDDYMSVLHVVVGAVRALTKPRLFA